MTRHYTPAQLAQRLEYTRQWRLRNKDKIRARELKYRVRRNKLARKRRKANPDKFREWNRTSRLRRVAKCREANRKYRERMLSQNPRWATDRNASFASKNPSYWREYIRRKKLRLAWMKFTKACADGRRVVG